MSGKVVSLTDYGAFVELEAGVEGLIHVSEMSWSKRVKHPSKILNSGDTVDAMVLASIPRPAHLARPQAGRDQPVARADREVPRSARAIKGEGAQPHRVRAFVEVEEDIDGLIHISDMSWSKRIKHPPRC